MFREWEAWLSESGRHLVFECLPELPIETTPIRSCFSLSPPGSSLNFFPQMESPPDPFPNTKSPAARDHLGMLSAPYHDSQ